jgi:hypothetical protein
MLGEWLGDRTHFCSDVVGSILALHLLSLSHLRYLAQLVVHEYIRNWYIGQQARKLVKKKRGGVNALDGGFCPTPQKSTFQQHAPVMTSSPSA